jgi:hypothetical protein
VPTGTRFSADRLLASCSGCVHLRGDWGEIKTLLNHRDIFILVRYYLRSQPRIFAAGGLHDWTMRMLRSESLSTKKDTGRQVLRIQAAAGFLSGDSETGAMRLMNCNVLD